MALSGLMQAVLFNMRKHRHAKLPAQFAFASVPAAAGHTGVEIQVIDRGYRPAISNGTVWQWKGTNTTIS